MGTTVNTEGIGRLRMVEQEPFLRPGETREQRRARREKELEGIDEFATKVADYVDVGAPTAELCRFVVGDRILWHNPAGIGGIILAARIIGILVLARTLHPHIIGLDIEPSDVMRRANKIIRETAGITSTVKTQDGLSGDGGRLFMTGDALWHGVAEGRVYLASDTEEERAKLAEPPDWIIEHERVSKLSDWLCEQSAN